MTFLRFALLFVIVFAALPVAAQGTRSGPKVDAVAPSSSCGPHRQTIVNLADRIIAEKHLAEGFSGANYGTLAAYLKLRQQEIGLKEGLALMDFVGNAGRRPPRMLDELRLMFAISHLGVEQGLTVTGETEIAAFARYQTFVPRQIILADGGESYFRLLRAIRADPAHSERFEKSYLQGLRLPSLLLDQSDAFKLDFALRAEAAGEVTLAAMVLGSRKNLNAYYDLLRRHADSELPRTAGPVMIDRNLMTARYQTRPQSVDGDDAERRAAREAMFDIMRASYQMGGIAWLSILFNVTGETGPIAEVARDFLKALERGWVMPNEDLEGAWLYLRSRLAEEMGESALTLDLSSFDLSGSVRHYRGRANDVLDWMEAIVALGAYTGGKEAELPERPELLADDFDWARWQRVAQLLRNQGSAALTNADPQEAKIGLELLYRAGDVAGSIELAAEVTPHRDRLAIYRDLMQRLDRRCDGYSVYTGDAIILGGQVLYRFD